MRAASQAVPVSSDIWHSRARISSTTVGWLRKKYYSAFGQKIFHITEAQTEAMIDPYGVADDFRRETVSVVTGWGAVHEMSLSVGRPS
jgi:hypothetical protein